MPTERVLAGLRKGSREYTADGAQCGLSVSTNRSWQDGIAAAVIERILFGDPEDGTAGDPDAVFLWLTDDPSLNEQTRKKLLEASDRIQSAHLVTLDERFDEPEFERGKVYFLNIQKLAKTSGLVVKKEGRAATSCGTPFLAQSRTTAITTTSSSMRRIVVRL